MWPPVTFDVMLSNGLYRLMSWSVLAGALPFWSLALSGRSLYPVYAVCGRFLPIPAVADQQRGGVVMWVLGAATYAVAFFIVLGRNLEQEEAALNVRRLADQW